MIVEEHVNKSTVTEDTYQPSPLLWQVGEQDDSSAEFTVYQDVYSENITLPVNPLNWNTISRGMKLDRNAAMELSFNLTEVPPSMVWSSASRYWMQAPLFRSWPYSPMAASAG
ncbi:hypothetical protein ACFSQ7_50305 [Paenibacillus rhizoplanae]